MITKSKKDNADYQPIRNPDYGADTYQAQIDRIGRSQYIHGYWVASAPASLHTHGGTPAWSELPSFFGSGQSINGVAGTNAKDNKSVQLLYRQGRHELWRLEYASDRPSPAVLLIRVAEEDEMPSTSE